MQHAVGEYQKGAVRFLSVIATEPDPEIPEVPAVTSEYPEFFKYLPWGAFYGVHVKKGIDPEILNILMDEYQKAGNNKEFQNMLKKYKVIPLGYSGLEAAKYIYTWRENTVDALVTSGAEGVMNVPTNIPDEIKNAKPGSRFNSTQLNSISNLNLNSGSASTLNFPKHEITGIVQWGKGGATDILNRGISDIVAKNTGWKFNIKNVPGEAGAIGAKQVYDLPADGHTLLMAAENPSTYDALGISDVTFKNFNCVHLIGYIAPVVVVNPASKFNTFNLSNISAIFFLASSILYSIDR